MHRRPGSTLRAAKQALPVDSSLSPAEVFQHLEILERQQDGPSVVQQRYFDAYEAALGVMEVLDESLLRPEVRLSGRLVQGHWNQSFAAVFTLVKSGHRWSSLVIVGQFTNKLTTLVL